MSFQISEIVLFSHDDRQRVLGLRPGRVSVITGASKTGKSALAHIVDYCLASKSCSIPEGIIRRSVAWYGLKLSLGDGSEAFVARRAPKPGFHTSTEAHFDTASAVEVPAPGELTATTNRDGLLKFLTAIAGIGPNLHEPPTGQTRRPLAANLRHALSFAYQPQDVILRRDQLFHNQGDTFGAQAIKDTLPYFLGAVNDDHLQRKEELRRLKRGLADKERRLATMEAVKGRGMGKAAALLSEASDLGIGSDESPAASFEEAVERLRALTATPVDDQVAAVELGGESGEYDKLMRARTDLQEALRRARWDLETAQALVSDEKGYNREAREQVSRLQSIALLPAEDEAPRCPLCAAALTETTPPVEAIEEAIRATSDQLERVGRHAPHLQTVVSGIDDRISDLRRRLAENREGLESIRASQERVATMREASSRRAHVVGRISLYLESLPEAKDASKERKEIESLRARIAALESELSDDAIQSRMDSFLSLLGRSLTDAAEVLDLEHADHPLRFDYRNLTVVADATDGPIPMDRMGSAANWVGYHLVTHFALHRWFVDKDRPIPRFLFLDQPSEVYFPSDEAGDDSSIASLDDDDRDAVVRMFRLAFDFVRDLEPRFQLVVTEHADISEDWYSDAIVERWRGGQKLVPDDWPEGDEP